ncbi:MAG: hypothetical protein OXF25_02890 [Cyanobacteria bacterium MAG CAR3_bin_5]|nr:hypothetical protein [Cyanobacteria bacterium MAG CAR3_bin_5]
MTVSGATTTYRVTTVDDEEDGAVTATIESGARGTPWAAASATVAITDDDDADAGLPMLSTAAATAVEGQPVSVSLLPSRQPVGLPAGGDGQDGGGAHPGGWPRRRERDLPDGVIECRGSGHDGVGVAPL